MAVEFASRLERAIEKLPTRYPGPGGAAAVVREGEVLVQSTWGFADVERRIAFSPGSLFRLGSVTKQFTCGLILDAFEDPSVLDDAVCAQLPNLQQERPSTVHLCHNMSGLRDIWAVLLLHGAVADLCLGEQEIRSVIGSTKTLQFLPGSRFSYANQNFRILSDVLQDRTSRSFSEMLQKRIFEPVGMEGASYSPDTRINPGETVGYEGDRWTGFRAAANATAWTGDGGIIACLRDLIAWEKYIDVTRDDPLWLYHRLSAPVAAANGEPGPYGFGLNRWFELGHATNGHTGSIRGWHMHRLHCPSKRISIVVMFNHMAEAHTAALELFAAILNEDQPQTARLLPPPSWLGGYCEAEGGLSIRVDTIPSGRLRLRYGQSAQLLTLQADGTATNAHTRLRLETDGLWLDRPNEKRSFLLTRSVGLTIAGLAGRYRCAELQSELTVAETNGVLYAAFSGSLGLGRMELLDPVAGETWTLPVPRGLDYAPPGDWTLTFKRELNGQVSGADVGCWRARGFTYVRVE